MVAAVRAAVVRAAAEARAEGVRVAAAVRDAVAAGARHVTIVVTATRAMTTAAG